MPTRRGLALLVCAGVLAVAGVVLGVEEFVLVALVTGALFVVSAAGVLWQVLGARRSLEVRLGPLPAEIAVGDEVSSALVVANRGRRVLAVAGAGQPRWRLSHPGLSRPASRPTRQPTPRQRLGGAGAWRLPAGPACAALSTGGSWDTPVTIPTCDRGVLHLEPFLIWCAGPLGLLCWALHRPATAKVIVVPRPSPAGGPIRRPPTPGHGPPDNASVRQAPAGSDEFGGLRPYVPGDRLSRLHWPSVARRGGLLVRHFVETPPQLLELLVDLRPWKIEDSVAQAAAVGLAELGRGGTVAVRTASGEELVVAPGPRARTSLLRGLAVIAPLPGYHSPVLRSLGAPQGSGR